MFSQKWIIIQLWNQYHCDQHAWKPQGTLSLALQIQRKVMFYSKMCFLRNGSTYSFDTCSYAVGMPENFRVCWVWPPKYKGKWCFIPKCVFAETDHHTALKLGPLQLTHLKTSGSAEFGPPNTKESDVLFLNVFFSEMDHCITLRLLPLWSACLETSVCT